MSIAFMCSIAAVCGFTIGFILAAAIAITPVEDELEQAQAQEQN